MDSVPRSRATRRSPRTLSSRDTRRSERQEYAHNSGATAPGAGPVRRTPFRPVRMQLGACTKKRRAAGSTPSAAWRLRWPPSAALHGGLENRKITLLSLRRASAPRRSSSTWRARLRGAAGKRRPVRRQRERAAGLSRNRARGGRWGSAPGCRGRCPSPLHRPPIPSRPDRPETAGGGACGAAAAAGGAQGGRVAGEAGLARGTPLSRSGR